MVEGTFEHPQRSIADAINEVLIIPGDGLMTVRQCRDWPLGLSRVCGGKGGGDSL